jgi:PKD repeat protein
MKFNTLLTFAVATFTFFGATSAHADNMASIAITPATGVVTLTPRWAIGGNLAGFHQKSQNLGLTGSVANNFYSLKAGTIPSGGDILAFNFYVAGSGSATPHADIGSKLTPDSYSALTSADPDVGYGSVNLYTIHHKGTTDYFTAIIPGSGSSSAVTDEKPMSGPGGPGTVTGVSGYFSLTFAAGNLGYGLNSFYYLRTDPVTGNTKFGTLAPALLGSSADQFDLGTGGHKALTYTGTDVGFGVDKMYYLRLDPVTGFTILGMLDPAVAGIRHTSDIANLGSVFTNLTFVPGDVGFGASNFYATGAINPTWQSVSFAAIPDRAMAAGSFTVNPTASSALPIVLTVVAGSATVSGPIGGVFTVTPTAPGVITLQATQAGAVAPIAYEANMLRQTFTVTGVAGLAPAISNSPLTSAGTVSTAYSFTITASQSPTSYSASPLPAGLVVNTTTGAITGTPTTVGVTDVLLGATNASGTGNATLRITVAAAGVAPIITNNPLTAAGTVASGFNFAVVATGSPTSYSATGLPPGLSLNTATGAITGTPTTSGTYFVVLTATNASGTGTSTLALTVAPITVAPIITSPSTAPGTVGAPFLTYLIAATGLPTSYTATGLPPGLTLNAQTGAITGVPTAAGTSNVTLTATNTAGTSTATLTIVVAPATVAPVITSPTTAPGATGTPFITYVIAATGLPTSYTATGLPPGLTLNPLTGAINGTPTTPGTYAVTITATNTAGTSTTTLTIVIAGPSSRIINFSARALSGPASQTLIMGFVTSGSSNKNLLVRGVGPTLASFGVANPLADPFLTVFDGSNALATNDDWQTSSLGVNQGAFIAATAAQVGAFALPNGSKDSAVLINVTPGAHTSMLRPNSTTGVALMEIYDTDTILGARLVNVSARMNVTPGEGTLIAGLIIAGNAPKTVLIRGVGPTLAAFNVAGALADPQISVVSGNTQIATNDDWSTGTSTAQQIVSASAQVGAFALPAGSKDAALLVTLQPGVYTVVLTGVGNTSGVALIEVYDVL